MTVELRNHFRLRSVSSRNAGKVLGEVICKSGFLDFVHRLYFNKITTFQKLDLLPSSGKKKGRI
jgi:hypothetical protein